MLFPDIEQYFCITLHKYIAPASSFCSGFKERLVVYASTAQNIVVLLSLSRSTKHFSTRSSHFKFGRMMYFNIYPVLFNNVITGEPTKEVGACFGDNWRYVLWIKRQIFSTVQFSTLVHLKHVFRPMHTGIYCQPYDYRFWCTWFCPQPRYVRIINGNEKGCVRPSLSSAL